MPSCRHTAPPRATFLQVGEGGGHPDALVISLSSRGSFLRDHDAASTILFSIFILFEKKMRKKLVENHEQCRPWARLPPSENECFVRSVHRDVFSCYIRLVISIRGLSRARDVAEPAYVFICVSITKVLCNNHFYKSIQTHHYLYKLVKIKKNVRMDGEESK